jgi:hypothetical protein
MSLASHKVGERLSAQVSAETGGAPLPGAMSLLLASPMIFRARRTMRCPSGPATGCPRYTGNQDELGVVVIAEYADTGQQRQHHQHDDLHA